MEGVNELRDGQATPGDGLQHAIHISVAQMALRLFLSGRKTHGAPDQTTWRHASVDCSRESCRRHTISMLATGSMWRCGDAGSLRRDTVKERRDNDRSFFRSASIACRSVDRRVGRGCRQRRYGDASTDTSSTPPPDAWRWQCRRRRAKTEKSLFRHRANWSRCRSHLFSVTCLPCCPVCFPCLRLSIRISST